MASYSADQAYYGGARRADGSDYQPSSYGAGGGRAYETTTTRVVETTEYVRSPDGNVVYAGPSFTFDVDYLRTLYGILKIMAICLCLLVLICVALGGPSYQYGLGWATFVASVGLFFSVLFLSIYVFGVDAAAPQVPWIMIEMCFYFPWSLFFFIAACILAIASTRQHASFLWAVAAFFAFGAVCTYGFDCYLKFKAWRENNATKDGGPAVRGGGSGGVQQI